MDKLEKGDTAPFKNDHCSHSGSTRSLKLVVAMFALVSAIALTAAIAALALQLKKEHTHPPEWNNGPQDIAKENRMLKEVTSQ